MSRKDEDKEHEILRQNILGFADPSSDSKKSPLISNQLEKKIFNRLFDRRREEKGETASELADHLLNNSTKDSNIRAHIGPLRSHLDTYRISPSGRDARWRCTLPPIVHSEGYRLVLQDTSSNQATKVFWQPHCDAFEDIVIVCNEPLFYREDDLKVVIRDLAVNQDSDNNRALVREQHRIGSPVAPNFTPSRMYMLSGEVTARDLIDEWLLSRGEKAKRAISHRLDQSRVEGSSPILLGNARTNEHIQTVLRLSHYGEVLGYQLQPDKVGVIDILHITSEEQTNIKRWSPGSEGLLSKDSYELRDNTKKSVFGVITRIPNPWNSMVPITIIATEWTRALAKLALMLTTESSVMKLFVNRVTDNATKPLPTCFQGLFAIPLDPNNRDAQALNAELLGSRVYETLS